MPAETEKQIWEEVLNGNTQTATIWSKAQRAQQKQTTPKTTQQPLALYLEPSLSANNGHQLNLADCYTQLLNKLGYRTIIAHALDNSLQQKEDWLPYFLVKHHTMSARSINTLADLQNVEDYFVSEFARLIEDYDPTACIFATIRFTNIVAAARAVTSHNIQFVIFGVMEAADVPDCDDPGTVRSAFIWAAALLQQHGVSHLLVAETDHVKKFLLSCGFHKENVKVFPYVAAKLITDIAEPIKRHSKNIQIGYLGGSRAVRHPELIADLLVSEPLPASADLNVQLDLNYIKANRGNDISDVITRMHKNGSIRLYPPNLSDQQYRSLFCSLDFIILPYGERYQQIGSGILLEAIYAGVIPVLPADSKLNDTYASLGGDAPCFKGLSANAIRIAITAGVTRYHALKTSATTIRGKWQQNPLAYDQWQAEITKWLPSYNV